MELCCWIPYKNRRATQSNDKHALADFLNLTKSNSPLKRRELYETPKVQKSKITLKFTLQKKEIQPKVFQSKNIIFFDRKIHHSASKLVQAERSHRRPSEKNIKIILSREERERKDKGEQRNKESREKMRVFEEKKEEDSIFKNSFLKNLSSEEHTRQREMSDFIIRKKVPYAEQENIVNLFNSVLSSLRRDKK